MTDPNLSIPNLRIPVPPATIIPRETFQVVHPAAELNAKLSKLLIEERQRQEKERMSYSASGFFVALMKEIRDEESQLSEGEQLLTTFYDQGEPIYIDEVGYHDPQMFILMGVDQHGQRLKILLHKDAVKLTFRRVKPAPKEPNIPEKKPMGFYIAE